LFGVMVVMAVASPTWAKEPPVEKVRLSIPSMHCELCPVTIRKALERLPGVLRVRASLASRTATVWIQEGKIRIRDLKRATEGAGYPATLLSVRFLPHTEGNVLQSQ
ncbi:mercuric transport protein periplasmic component, partial [mine drainage metagenome]